MALSREQMVETIRGGGSVSYKGKLITSEENIPGIEAFEMTDEQRETERAKLQKQLDALDNAPSATKEKSDEKSMTDDFKPLSLEKTIEAMKKHDFSERATRSMAFHGEALKEKIAEENGNGEKDDDFPEGFPVHAKTALKKLGKTYADIKGLDREKLIDLPGIADKTADDILAFGK